MKNRLKIESAIFVIGLLLFLGCSQTPKTPMEELISLGEQMKQHEQVAYAYQIKLFRSYAGDTSQNEGIIYFETNPADTNMGFNYNQESEGYASFYNGAYSIHMSQKDSFAYKKPFCDYEDGHMTQYPYQELSYAAIQNFLTDSLFTVRTDSIVKTDTMFDDEPCHSFSFWTDSRIVDTYKLPRHEGRKKIRLIVRQRDHLPVFYSQFQPIPDSNYHLHEATFIDYSFKKRYPQHKFSIENVPEYYNWDAYKAYYQTLELHTTAPEWKLPLVSGNKISLTDLKGKYVLLDFWFIGCGACVQSIPTLNSLQAEYKNADFEVIGINLHSNNVEKVEAYCSDRDMHFKNVWKGDIISDDYLIKGAPIFYLIDKEGMIAYTQIGHDEKLLIDNVERIVNAGI